MVETHIFIDVETTGFGFHGRPPREDAVIQVGIAWRSPGRMNTWSMYCNPGGRFYEGGRADEAFDVNGIGIITVRSSPDAEHVARNLMSIVSSIGKERTFHSYNKDFDREFLNVSPWNLKSERWGDDPMIVFADRYNNGRYVKLSVAAAKLGIVIPSGYDNLKFHSAEKDALTGLLLLEKLESVDSQTNRLVRRRLEGSK